MPSMDTSARPQPTPTSVDTPAATAVRRRHEIDSIHTEDHVVWDEPDRIDLARLEPGFVVGSWLLGVLATVAIFALSTGVVSIVSAAPITGATNTELGVLTILSAMSTFIGFVVVMVMRLVRVDHDRVVNSLAVAALHVAVALVLFLGELVLRNTTDVAASTFLAGNRFDQLGNAFTVLERSSAAAVIACLLAIGMVPARGARPQGTQTDPTPQDRQL